MWDLLKTFQNMNKLFFPCVLSFPPYLLSLNSWCRESKGTAFLTIILRVLYQIPSSPPFSIHWFNRALAGQRQRILDDSPAVMCTTPIRRFIWFIWNQAPLVDIRWLSRLKLQISSKALPCPCPGDDFPIIVQSDNFRGDVLLSTSYGQG